jgi:CubicO group peptidase (beta-lactamase class C family)
LGEYGWGGVANTFFVVDPVNEIFAIFFTQLIPSSAYPIRNQLRHMVHWMLQDEVKEVVKEEVKEVVVNGEGK